jgi:hypothetical protein
MIGAAADPLSIRAAFWLSQSPLHSASAFSIAMAALLIILLATIGLAVRAVTYRRQWSVVNSEHPDNDTGFVDTCARTFVLVLLSLLGLMALGMMYGNVLGSANAIP